MSEPAAVKVHGLHKAYRMGKVELHVLKGVSFDVAKGEFAAIVGASGSGKSTLLHLIGLLDRPNKGAIELAGRDTGKMGSSGRNAIRRRDVGFVFQFYHLLGELNVLENIILPAMVDSSAAGWLGRSGAAKKRAAEIADRLGLGERLKHRPSELSGGERQRVAIARALMNRPGLLLADEPTGNLDSNTGRQIIDQMMEFNRSEKQTIIMVTHDQSLAARAHSVLKLQDGKLAD
ncbi:MAG: ABC transporter ATP-binding protein [Planctomycetes bacterium]|nr:ABC transporter ATP-binding protein [Planctomycetota bacterium]